MKLIHIPTIAIALLLGAFASAVLAQGLPAQKTAGQSIPRSALMAPADAPSIGPVSARVTIVEFFDPACEACRAMHPYVKQILADNPKDVRLVMRYVPFHGELSVVAIQILEAARQQRRFEPVLAALLQNQPAWASHGAPNAKQAWVFAVAAGLDHARAEKYISSGTVEKTLKRELAASKAAEISGTPTFFVNGKALTKLDPQQLAALVASEIARNRKTP